MFDTTHYNLVTYASVGLLCDRHSALWPVHMNGRKERSNNALEKSHIGRNALNKDVTI